MPIPSDVAPDSPVINQEELGIMQIDDAVSEDGEIYRSTISSPEKDSRAAGVRRRAEDNSCDVGANTEIGTSPRSNSSTSSAKTAVVIKSGPEVALEFSKNLWVFACVYVYSAAVDGFVIVTLFTKASLEGHELRQMSGLIVYTCCRSVAAILVKALTIGFSVAAGRHFSMAAGTASLSDGPSPNEADKSHLGRHVEKAVIYLCPLFNTLGVTMMFGSMLALMESAILYPETIAVVAVAILLVALFWVFGYLVFRRWYYRSGWAGAGESNQGLHLRGLLVATRKERSRIPPFIRFWLRQVIGRPELQRDGDVGESGAAAFPWDGIKERSPLGRILKGPKTEIEVSGSYANVKFSEEQIHLLRILPQAMWQCAAMLGMRVFTSLLLLITELITDRPFIPIMQFMTHTIRYLIFFCLVVAGAFLFEAAVHDTHCSHIQSLLRAFVSLSAMFRRISIMLSLTATFELFGLVFGLIRAGIGF